MQFKDIKGLDEVKRTLIRGATKDQVAHALLFAGKEGAPNMPMALAFATFLNCENRLENDSCGVCPSCVKNNKYIFPDLHFVYPVNTTKKVTDRRLIHSTTFIKEWRNFLNENPFGNIEEWSNYFGSDKQLQISKEESRQIITNLSLKSFEGKYKVMIIWLPELMHPASANGILKILEEPPSETIFILVSNQQEKLLSTIISRTQRFYIPLFSDIELSNILNEDYQVPKEDALVIAQLADGNLNEAVRLLNQTSSDHHQFFTGWMRECYKKDLGSLVQRSDEFHMMNKVSQKSFLQYALSMIRESLIHHAQAATLQRSTGEKLTFIENFSKAMHPDAAQDVISLINEGYAHLERNASAKIMFLDLSLTISKTIN